MNRETIQKLLQQRPFVPFEVYMSNGQTHRIGHPEVAVLGKSVLVVVNPETDGVDILGLLHINRVSSPQFN